jgi:hypothetical protein
MKDDLEGPSTKLAAVSILKRPKIEKVVTEWYVSDAGTRNRTN